jgi:preprotein translocase subunit YajC
MTILIQRTLTVVAMAAPNDNSSPWAVFLPMVLMLAIVYFVLLLPMKRRQ